jgi:hypothetical protein
MDPSTKRNFQIALVLMLVLAGARTLWIFHERSDSSMPEKPAVKERNEDDYVYLRPSHAHDLASARAVLKGNTVWVKAGNAVAYYSYNNRAVAKKELGTLPPIDELLVHDVVMNGDQMMAVFTFAASTTDESQPKASSVPQCLRGEKAFCAAPIGLVKHGDATILIDDMFFLSDPHKLYSHWTKERWASIERHEITQGMSEMQAQAAMGIGRAPESGADGDYGNRTLAFTDPAHPDQPVTVKFVDNAAVSISH